MRLLVSRLDGPYGKELPGILHRAGHTVVGTAPVGWPKQPRFVDEIKYTTSYMDNMGEPVHECEGMDEEEFKLWIRECQGYICDIFTDVIEARSILQHIAKARPDEEAGEAKKQFVALSNISTWANTTRPVDPDAEPPGEGEEIPLPEPFKAEDRRLIDEATEEEPGLRIPHNRFKREAGFEQLLCNTEWFNVDPIVMCTGLVYGDGEDWMHPLFQRAWLTGRLDQITTSASHRVPMVHRADVLTAVNECFGENKPGSNYVLAVDESNATFGEVACAIQKAFSDGDAPEEVTEAEISQRNEQECQEHEAMIAEATHFGYPEYMMYKSDLRLDPEPFVGILGDDVDGEPPRWRARAGIIPAIQTVVDEYKAARMIGPKRIFIDTADVDTPCAAVKALGDRIAARFQVPHVTIDYAIKMSEKAPADLAKDVKSVLQGKMTKAQLRKSQAEAAARAEAEADAESGEAEASQPLETTEERAEVPGVEGTAVTPHPEMNAAPTEPAVVGADIKAYEPVRQLEIDKNYAKITTADPKLLNQLFRHVLSSHECRSRGFVLSGYPKTIMEANELFRDLPPAKPAPAEGEEEPDAEDNEDHLLGLKIGPDGKVEGQLMPEFTIVIEGPDAHVSSLLPPTSAFINSSEKSKERFQGVTRLAADSLQQPAEQALYTEKVIQTIGLPLHFEKDIVEESLDQRQQVLRETISKAAQEQPETEEPTSPDAPPSPSSQAKLAHKERVLLENRQEALMSAVEEELLSNVDASDMAARDYALKYALPALQKAMCLVGRLRPDDPVDFMSTFMFEYDPENSDFLEPGKLDLPKFGQPQ